MSAYFAHALYAPLKMLLSTDCFDVRYCRSCETIYGDLTGSITPGPQPEPEPEPNPEETYEPFVFNDGS